MSIYAVGHHEIGLRSHRWHPVQNSADYLLPARRYTLSDRPTDDLLHQLGVPPEMVCTRQSVYAFATGYSSM